MADQQDSLFGGESANVMQNSSSSSDSDAPMADLPDPGMIKWWAQKRISKSFMVDNEEEGASSSPVMKRTGAVFN